MIKSTGLRTGREGPRELRPASQETCHPNFLSGRGVLESCAGSLWLYADVPLRPIQARGGRFFMECTACLRVGSGCLSTTVSRMTGQPWRRASRVVTDFIHSIRRVDPFLSPKFEICGIGGSRAFSDEVDTGSSKKMRPNKSALELRKRVHISLSRCACMRAKLLWRGHRCRSCRSQVAGAIFRRAAAAMPDGNGWYLGCARNSLCPL